jgi:hypothetical protein
MVEIKSDGKTFVGVMIIIAVTSFALALLISNRNIEVKQETKKEVEITTGTK